MFGLCSSFAWGQSSYTEYLKNKLKNDSSGQTGEARSQAEGYSEYQKSKLGKKPTQGYSDYLKQKAQNANETQPQESSEGYTQKLKNELTSDDAGARANESTGGAIQALKEGRSELKLERPGKIKANFSFKLGAKLSRDLQNRGGSSANFQNIYGNGWFPDLAFTYEVFPFYDEIFGNLAVWGGLGAQFERGKGQFVTALSVEGKTNGKSFGTTSATEFRFYGIPVLLGLKYRMNLLKYLRPFAAGGPAAIGMLEYRNDEKPSHRAVAFGYHASVGVSLLMDWIGRSQSWELYDNYGAKHYYFTFEYQRVSSTTGTLKYLVDGLYGGFSMDL